MRGIESSIFEIKKILYNIKINNIKEYDKPDNNKLYTYGLELKVLGNKFINLAETQTNKKNCK